MSGSERIGDCDVLFELASGGMATVLLARQSGDAGFERLVALKRVHRHLVQDPEVFAMASDEARLAALVRHPNVVAVTGVLDAGGELVLVQEYVEGFGLARLLRELDKRGERLAPEIAARIVIDAARGLHATHEAKDLMGEPLGIVHRDVSPQNLLVGSDGTTRLIDFGIARAERRMAMTRTGILKGKLAYMAPEQIEEHPVDRRADVFAAGAVLYEALTGTRAYAGTDDASVMAKILAGAPDLAPVEAAAPSLAPVVERALARRPEDRYATAQDLAKAVAAGIVPADEDDVKALVARTFATELDRLRDRIAGAIAHAAESEEEPSPPEEAAALVEPVAARPKPSRRGPIVIAAGLALAVPLVWWASRPPSGNTIAAVTSSTVQTATPASAPAPSSDSSVPTAGPTSSAAPLESTSAAASSAVDAAPSTSTRPRTAPPPSNKPAPSTSGDLHPSPYRQKP
jgi:serine/threonine protein kinase